MAIFSGNWKDGDGVPFDPNAFVLEDYGGSGSARRKRKRPRRTYLQGVAAGRFVRAGHQWSRNISEQDRDDWEEYSGYTSWRERQGANTPLHGYRNWMRSQIPTFASEVPQKTDRPWTGDPFQVELTHLWYVSGTGRIWWRFAVVFENDEERSHLEIFQVMPEKAEFEYEVKLTRAVYSEGWWLRGVGILTGWFYPAWTVPAGEEYRCFLRYWNVHDMGQQVRYTGAAP